MSGIHNESSKSDSYNIDALMSNVFSNLLLWEEFMIEGKKESLLGYCRRRKDYLIEKLEKIQKEQITEQTKQTEQKSLGNL